MNEEQVRQIVQEEICHVLQDMKQLLDDCVQQSKVNNKKLLNTTNNEIKHTFNTII
ncbi:hypothetical protein CBC_A1713 [Clostridium botulinum C str. Eklund]|nr:hypothetical protein CBC_A1713 [Clostridium botulinum C str. Eklund]